ncbi:MAG: glycosyltransferase family 2 protein [Desulfobacteraceae bacterium]|nr:MAG: glycosyltransferase family 2 protein [Desulfobacteraceae bacterium]
MIHIFETLFWLSMAVTVYCYLLYPVCVRAVGRLRPKSVNKRNREPFVSIIISAYNEARFIKRTLENKLSLRYPPNKMELIIVSDGSDDGTDEIIKSHLKPNIRFVRQEPRQGKSAALNRAVAQARGEIICFSDANSIWDENALFHMARNFADATVGYVTGKMIYSNSTGNPTGAGCGLYMKYENKLREWESGIGSIVGVDGGIDAIRSNLYETIDPSLLPDLILPLKVIEKGFRVVYEPKAVLREESLDNSQDEFKMRMRVSLRALHVLWRMRHLLNPFRYGLFSWQLLSHKWLRYFAWIFILSALITNVISFDRGLSYRFMLFGQSFFYAFAILGYASEKFKIKLGKISTFPYYFIVLNLSSAAAFLKFIKGQNMVTWQPRKG